jgi:hypothetical protein
MKSRREMPLTLTDADITSRRCLTRRSLLSALGITAGIGASVLLPAPAFAQDNDAKPKGNAGKSKADGDKGPPFRARGRSHDRDGDDAAGSARTPKPVPGGLPGAKPESDDQRRNEPR